MNKKSKVIMVSVAAVLIVAIVALASNIIIKNSNQKSVEKENAMVISNAIRALSDSSYRDLELANMIYAVGLTKPSFVKDNFPKSADIALETILDSSAEEALLNMIPESLYGGIKVSKPIKGIKGEPTENINVKNLKVGDLLFVKKSDEAMNYIFDRDGLVDLSKATAKVDTQAVLNGLSKSDIFAVFRPSLIIEDYDYITEKSPELKLTPEQEAVIVTANSFLLRGEKLQYADTRLGQALNSEFRWKAGFFSPEDYTSDNWGYTNCAAFTYDVYYNALGMDLHNLDTKFYTTYNQMNYSEEIGIRKYHMICESADSYTAEDKERIKREIYDLLEPADILVVRRGGNGHSMLYIGNGNIIHSGGSVYNYSDAKENYEASIRQMRFDDYFFTEGAGGYIFGSDIGKEVSSFAILRPLDIFEGEIPEVTQNRVKNMQGIMAQKLSTHNATKTVNRGEEITFTFEVYNSNDNNVSLEISDIVPENTTYISGAEKKNGNKLSWKINLEANTRKKVSYKVRVNQKVEYGTAIRSVESFVGGIPVRCPEIIVNRTLSEEEQAKIITALENFKNNKGTKGFELVNDVYKNAINVENIFADTDFHTIVTSENGVFNYDPEGVVSSSGARDYWINQDSTYNKLMVPTLYGGRNLYQLHWSNRTRLPREHNLLVGDILVRKTLSGEQIFIFVGKDKFYNISEGLAEDTLDTKTRLETCIGTGNCFAVIRPSFGIK